MTTEEHRARHRLLHRHLDELVADWIGHTKELPSKATVYDLMRWAYDQTIHPTEIEDAKQC